MDKKKSVLICGAGSIGVYLGTKLHSKKHDVKLFGKRKLRGVEGEVIINGKKFEVPEKIFKLNKDEKHDLIFITSKLYDLDKVIGLIKKNNIKGKILVSIQNGLVDLSKYEKILGKKIIPIVVFSGFNLKNNEIHVSPTPIGWKTRNSSDGKIVSKILLDAGIPCTTDSRFDSLRAEKTIVNSCLNSLSAIENKPFCELFKNNKTKDRIEKLFDECYNVLSKKYELEKKELMKKKMFRQWSKLKHYSSTCQDIKSGRKNEARYFNGLIVELGEKYNIPVDNNKEILREIREISKR